MVKLFETNHQAIRYEWGCLSYLSGVKISDLVPFTMSQTLVEYQRPSWYLLRCFSLNKIPEISITKAILMIWLEPLEHIDKGVFIFRIFQFFVFKLVLFRGYTSVVATPTRIRLRYFYNFIGVIFEIHGAHPRPLMYRGSSGGADTCSTLEI